MFIHDMFQLIPSVEVARNGNTGGSVLPGFNVEVKYITADVKSKTNRLLYVLFSFRTQGSFQK